eukprot:10682466-Karenia_brevis.AAC.1
MGPVNTIMHMVGIINGGDADIGRVWIRSQWDLDHASNPWARVKGPIGATQLHQKDIQWKVQWHQGTLRLEDHNGDIWHPDKC